MRANGIAICSICSGRRCNREDISPEIDRFGGTLVHLNADSGASRPPIPRDVGVDGPHSISHRRVETFKLLNS